MPRLLDEATAAAESDDYAACIARAGSRRKPIHFLFRSFVIRRLSIWSSPVRNQLASNVVVGNHATVDLTDENVYSCARFNTQLPMAR